ncbi:HlyD family type I secretion periplasmic adaptor subunit [Psychromonas antarctica]|jgi:adhesin transport system membrane fusion protein|uniref:HlyD family type I secretion periplasmic adaptor subunit n=1 Tax=Psychromonas antarctica TaxID=67573 RepID=UPI001EE94AE4|nr:HlyD family type I secretion periplasmic adaptor subunit [Psychromonas antarctica]MCG6200676.1 HlyD family type I secretion periplasmic adaptor subunit [Psychromonas antarctica]
MKITKEDIEMVDDVYGAMLTQAPSVHRLTIWSLAALFVCFFLWAYFAELDRVTRGEGKVIPSTQVQIIQSLDGGILQELYVKEGMMVKKGQILARIDDTRFRSDMAQQNKEVDALRADIIRLRTELSSILVADVADWNKQIMISKKSLKFPDDLKENSKKLVLRQQDEYNGRLNNLENQVAIQGHQIIQRQQEVKELDSKIDTLKTSLKLVNRELKLTRPLAEKNIVPEVELLKLERTLNDIQGELNSLRLLKPKQQSAFEEAVLKRREAVLKYRADDRAQLNELQSKFSRITEAQVGVQDKVKKALITSPVIGTINTVYITTLGGVIKPGQALLEIVPTEDKLLIEAKILPKDIAFIHVGLPARVKITAYDFTRYGGLEGTVEHISADTTQDEQGNSFYIIRVRTTESNMHSKDMQNMPIIPGMMTSVDVMISKRTVLEYILNPILRAKEMALREY